MSTVTPQDIQATLTISDPVQRNQHVTATYHALAVALVEKSGRPDLTWCAFATWASASAGRMIAMDEIPTRVRERLEASTDYQRAARQAGEHLHHRHILRAIELVAEQVSVAIAAGNTLVFAELAPMFVALLADEPLPSNASAPVAEAYARYRSALAGPDPAAAAQATLAANVVAVDHEQQRLQPYISAALNAGLTDAVHRVTHNRLIEHLTDEIGQRVRPMLAEAESTWDDELTRHATTLATPERVFDLGRDVPPLPDGARGPSDLERLAPDTAAVVGQFDRTDGTLVGSAARDWDVLADRMNYIVNLFRSRQHSADLLQAPDPAPPPEWTTRQPDASVG